MTDKQQELLQKLFSGYNCSRDGFKTYEIRRHFWKPEKIDELRSVQTYDKEAEAMIKDCEQAIETLTAYRAALFERYNEITTAPTVPVIKLKREHRYSYGKGNPVYYYLSVYSRNLNSGKDTQIESKCFEGKQRHEAIKAFEEYKKSHPGIIAYAEQRDLSD